MAAPIDDKLYDQVIRIEIYKLTFLFTPLKLRQLEIQAVKL